MSPGVKTVAEQVADAVLYEGYILYPYRPSALKNRQRWNFGGICPRAYSEAQKRNELWRTQCEVLVRGLPPAGSATGVCAALHIKVRFLHLVAREVAQINRSVEGLCECGDADFTVVPSLEISGRLFQGWQEAMEREVDSPEFALGNGAEAAIPFRFAASRTMEPLREHESIVAAVIRTQEEVDGRVTVKSERVGQELFRVTVEVANLTDVSPSELPGREKAMMHSLASCHSILSVRRGEFVSLLDPPAEFAEAAAECRNVGVYPVLVGAENERGTMLASPVILYDYPAIAPESAGDLFDGTEIDEILTLRILALTDAEKAELRASDERVRRILERIEANPEHLMNLHGAVRAIRPAADGGGAA
jgi:hypothetical protein